VLWVWASTDAGHRAPPRACADPWPGTHRPSPGIALAPTAHHTRAARSGGFAESSSSCGGWPRCGRSSFEACSSPFARPGPDCAISLGRGLERADQRGSGREGPSTFHVKPGCANGVGLEGADVTSSIGTHTSRSALVVSRRHCTGIWILRLRGAVPRVASDGCSRRSLA